MRVFVLSAAAIFFAAGSLVAQTGQFALFGQGCKGSGTLPGSCLVVPKAYATKMGQIANTFPQARANMRYQQMFLGSELGSPSPFVELCLRLDEQFGGPAQTQQIELKLGYTANTPATFSPTFASNYAGGAPMTVFKGNLNLPQHSGGGTINDFKICLKFTRLWLWVPTPAKPNLLTEWLNTSSSSVSHFEDKCQGASDCTTTRVWANTVTAASGSIERNGGLIMCLRRAGGSGAIPQLGNVGVPVIGRSFSVTLAGARGSTAALLWLGSRIAIPLPPNLAPGCTLYQNLLVLLGSTTTNAAGAGSQQLTFPNAPSLKGVKFSVQWGILDPAINALQLVFTNGGEGTIG